MYRPEAEAKVLDLAQATGKEADLARLVTAHPDWAIAAAAWDALKARHYGGLVDPFRTLDFAAAYPKAPGAKAMAKDASARLQNGIKVDRLEVDQESWSWSSDYTTPTRVEVDKDLFGDVYYTVIPGENRTYRSVEHSRFVKVKARVTNTHPRSLTVHYAYRVDVCKKYGDKSIVGALQMFSDLATGNLQIDGKCVGLDRYTVGLRPGESKWLNTTLDLDKMRMSSHTVGDLSVIVSEVSAGR